MTRGQSPTTVRFVIDRITLHGFSPVERERFLASLDTQLTHLGQSGELHSGATVDGVTERVTAALRTAAGRAR